MTAVVLHLSDIHIRSTKDPILQRGKDIAATVFSSLPAASHVFVVVSGDITFSGYVDEYKAATGFFSTIKETIQQETDCPVNFVMVPGNHDCDFSNPPGARKVLVDYSEQDNLDVDESIIDICTKIQEPFFTFRNSFETCEDVSDDKLWRTSRFKVQGKLIEFDCLNISWVSKKKEEPGHLYFPVNRYSESKLDHADVRFVVLHHPLNWFSQHSYRPFRNFVRKIANIILSGHEHQGNVGVVTEAESGSSAFVEGCVLQGDKQDLSDSSFNIVILDLSLGQFSSTRYSWDGSRYTSDEEGSWADYHDLPAKRTNFFTLKDVFSQLLDDPGAFFKHPSQVNVSLSDIYVYPDLRKIGNEEDRRRVFISSSRLLAPEVTTDGVLIEGEEKTGCTSLLYQLYRQYHDRGFIPLFIQGKDLKKVADKDIDNLIRKNVSEQYGEVQVDAYIQLTKTQKILLLDDFDDSPMKAREARADLLCALRKRFGHLVVTVGDMFEMREMLDGDASRALITLTHYKLQPFGHALRGQLINRWLSLGADGTIDESTAIARLDQAERLVNAVMQKSVIPAIPLYLLILLQSMDAGRGGDFKASALGDYYHYLLTEAFQNCGVKPDKLTEMFHYVTQLAWAFHLQGKRDFLESDLRAFNDRFTKQWHTVEFKPRLNVLLKARVLYKVGEDYAFRYPYIYYYLKGRYLSENLSDVDVHAYIDRCCQHLYVRDYANTVLFLSHHSTDEFVLNSIAMALHNLFRDRSPVRFDGDTGTVKKLIEDAPKLTYSGEKPAEHRTRRNAIEDQFDDGHDGLLESEECAEKLSLIAQMTMLLKTTEILGQVLKNQYSKIQRVQKGALLKDLFNGPLRALRDFFDFFERNPDALVAEIEAGLIRKKKVFSEEERKTFARKVAASLIQLISYGFMMRATQSANSESLLEDVRGVVEKNETPAFKLIELGIFLDSPRAIPRTQLKALHSEIKHDLVASRVLQIFVLNRLYMFKTSEQDMQWLSKELDIDLGMQHAITYQEKRQRRLTN